MRILAVGGTGVIGSAVVRELAARGHEVLALVRSDASAETALRLGAASVLRGDIATPEAWLGRLPSVEAVAQMACDFDSAMAQVERRFLDALLSKLAARGAARARFLYTGGCWLFGPTASDDAATERSPVAPLPAFAWMVPHARRVLVGGEVDGFVVHPGMVYDDGAGGLFRGFAHDAAERGRVRVVGGEAVRWPLVHARDLAVLYALALEHAPAGESYLGVATEAVPVGRIARAVARRFRLPDEDPDVVSADEIARERGEWARGYAMDQRLSGEKARRELGWSPVHTDPVGEIARWPGAVTD